MTRVSRADAAQEEEGGEEEALMYADKVRRMDPGLQRKLLMSRVSRSAAEEEEGGLGRSARSDQSRRMLLMTRVGRGGDGGDLKKGFLTRVGRSAALLKRLHMTRVSRGQDSDSQVPVLRTFQVGPSPFFKYMQRARYGSELRCLKNRLQMQAPGTL